MQQTVDAPRSTFRRPRVPGIVYGALALVVAVTVAAVALTARQPPPPTIAEFAPQAVETIRDAPSEQTSEFGSAPDGETAREDAAAKTGPVPAPGAAEAIELPRVRRCVGSPPRQTEDPQSPPCVAYWDGDNGGATAGGVTRDEIRIYVPAQQNLKQSLDPVFIRAMETFFNRRFEFYGRKLTLIPDQTGGTNKKETQLAAVDAAVTARAFASTFYQYFGGAWYHTELAARGIVSSMTSAINLDHRVHRRLAPYLWSYTMHGDQMQREIGAWICARLAGARATHAGALESRQERRFGILYAPLLTEGQDASSASHVAAELRRCDVASAYTVEDPSPPDTVPDEGRVRTQVLAFQREGVNSIVCLCNWILLDYYHQAATSQGYFPEWLVSTFADMDLNVMIKLTLGPANDPTQLGQTFGLTFRPRQRAIEGEPYMWALAEVAGTSQSLNNQDFNRIFVNREFYRSLLVLASGIQMAGPNVTPHTFASGLHKARFPNPDHWTQPGRAGFDGGTFAMTTDAAEWWWSNSAPSPYAGDVPGTTCYVDGGERHTARTWPHGDHDPFFSGDCDGG